MFSSAFLALVVSRLFSAKFLFTCSRFVLISVTDLSRCEVQEKSVRKISDIRRYRMGSWKFWQTYMNSFQKAILFFFPCSLFPCLSLTLFFLYTLFTIYTPTPYTKYSTPLLYVSLLFPYIFSTYIHIKNVHRLSRISRKSGIRILQVIPIGTIKYHT